MKDYTLLNHLAEKLLPGFPFFGASPTTSLKVALVNDATKVLVGVCAPEPEFLNISNVSFSDASGEVLPREEVVRNVDASSIYGDKSPEVFREAFFHEKMLHTKRELVPTIALDLVDGHKAKFIHVANRTRRHGARSNHLFVKSFDQSNAHVHFENFDVNRREAHAREICKKIGLNFATLERSPTMEHAVNTFRTAFSLAAERRDLELSDIEISYLLEPYRPTKNLNDHQTTVCALSVLNQLKGSRNSAPTANLRYLSEVLCRPESIKAVQGRVNSILGGSVSGGDLVLSKHGIHFSKLRTNRNRYLDGLDELFGEMESSKVQAQLCYGTLLGAVREKDFLAHDDDVDIIIHTGAKSKEEAIAHRDNLIQVLHQRDYKTFGILPEKNFHVVVGGAQFDLFPCWTEGGQIFLLMEGLKYRSIQEDIILPSSQVELCGRTYPAPNNPAEFLAERYGDSWETPDPYHEWPWALQRD